MYPSSTGTRLWRPIVSVEALVLLAALAFACAYNNALWKLLLADHHFPSLLSVGLFVVVAGLQYAGLALLVTRRTVKPVLAVLFLCTAFASYYMDRYAILLNKDMLRNVLRTDPAEARELLTLSLLPHLLLYAVLPIGLLFGVQLTKRPLRRAIWIRSGSVALALTVSVLALLVQFREASTLLREHREARHLITPTNYLAALYKIGRDSLTRPTGPRVAIGLDAHRFMRVGNARRDVLVLVVGETVRSANFGLSGYQRQTTPELAALDVTVFPRVQACGTSTEVSLPCMFSPVGRRDYDEQRIEGTESLLHLLARVGYQVEWIDNQSGCKGVCDGLPQQKIPGNADPTLCDGDRCLDEILQSRLDATLKASSGDLVVVLHMLGNHGPAYSRRYPAEFRHFKPTCESRDLGKCTRTEITNSYDNAVLYTDHVLANVIRYLDGLADWNSSLIYVSDHGESLGESGIYLHGLPWTMAPAVQKEVPMLVWLSDRMRTTSKINMSCFNRAMSEPVSHDHLFHSVLGLLGVETSAREPELDLFSECRLPAAQTQMVDASSSPGSSTSPGFSTTLLSARKPNKG